MSCFSYHFSCSGQKLIVWRKSPGILILWRQYTEFICWSVIVRILKNPYLVIGILFRGNYGGVKTFLMSSPNFVFGPKANSLRKASEYAILLEVIQWKKCENTVLNRNFADIQKFITSEWNTVLQRFFLGKICLDVFFISYFRTESRSLEKKSPKL